MIKKYLVENKKLIYIFAIVISVGIIFGIIAFDNINENEKKDITNLYKNSLVVAEGETGKTDNLIKSIVDDKLKISITFIMMGLFVFGRYGIFLVLFICGMNIGINNGMLYALIANKPWGVLAILYMLINLMYIAIYFILAMFNYKFSENLCYLIERDKIKNNMVRFLIYNLIISILLIVPIVAEFVVNHNLLNNIIIQK